MNIHEYSIRKAVEKDGDAILTIVRSDGKCIKVAVPFDMQWHRSMPAGPATQLPAEPEVYGLNLVTDGHYE